MLLICVPGQVTADQDAWITPSDEEMNAGREGVRNAMISADTSLDRWSSGNGWRSYLLWIDLAKAVDSDAGFDVVELAESRNRLLPIFTRLADNHSGLERTEFQDLRVAIRKHVQQINAVLMRRGPQEAEARRKRMEELVSVNRWTAAAQSEYNAHVRWLDDHLQPLPINAASANWDNFTASVSSNFIRDATRTSVTDPTDVFECIVGTRVIGTGTTSGTGWLEPVASNGGARLAARFSGVLNSDTVGYNGPVRIYSDGITQLNGVAMLALDSNGLRRLSTDVDAAADSQTKAISTNFKGFLDRVVRKVASRKAAESKSQANRESSFKARQSFLKRFENETHQQVSDGNASFHNQLRLPLLRRDLIPGSWIWVSERYTLNTRMRFDGRNRPSSLVGVPQHFNNGDHSSGIQVLIHQSFVDNVAEGYFGGRSQKLSQVGQAIDDKSDSQAGDDVVVILDDFQPLRSVFDNDTLTFHLLPKQIVTAGRETGGLVIKVSYRVQRDGNVWQLRRSAAPTVEPLPSFSRKPRLDASGSAMRVVIEPRLEADLPETLPLTLPWLDGSEAYDSVPKAVRELRIADVQVFGGWLSLSLQ
ncbi:MAG TPA: hypothetical protein DDZ51_11480 [Planctomycetaceae bacterium]|nr:hypothetical protein [Planctomycetaceae bacterium]